MNDRTLPAGLVAILDMAITAYAEACAAARRWGEGPASALPAILGPEHHADIEALRDAAIHQAAVEPWAAATARELLVRCLDIVDRGSRVIETPVWEEDETSMPYVAYCHRDVILDAAAEAAARAAAALQALATAIELSLDVDAAMARYGVPAR